MNYIVLDLEWNQPQEERFTVTEPFRFDSEIIEIGAIRLNDRFEEADSFVSYVKPRYYKTVNSSVVRLTKIRSNQLESAPAFQEAMRRFLDWCGRPCCLCSWSKTDASVLLDNMLLYGMEEEAESDLWFCDLQRIFGREILKDEHKCALETAVDMMHLPKDRAHDALNDARNTVRICERMDLAACIEEYRYRYACYAEDRMRGLRDGKLLPHGTACTEDDELGTMRCPYCGETLRFGEWTVGLGAFLGYARCAEGDEYLCKMKRRRVPGGDALCSRVIYEMSDDFWDIYQTAVETNGLLTDSV